MSRLLLDHFEDGWPKLPRSLDRPLKLIWVTGKSAATFIVPKITARLNQIEGLTVETVIVENRYYGETVTVSGLLIGADIAAAVNEYGNGGDAVLLPPNCLNDEGVTLDDLSTRELSARVGRPVLATDYEFLHQLRSWLIAPTLIDRSRAT